MLAMMKPDLLAPVAERYESHAVLEQQALERLLERAVFRRVEPQHIIDLGCGTGLASARLKKSFRKARVTALDHSPAMLAIAKTKSSLLRPIKTVCADLGALPLADNCADLLFSNMVPFLGDQSLAWVNAYRRVLKPDGLLLLSSLGRGSLGGMALPSGDGSMMAPGFPLFPDIMELGDLLMGAGFSEPVMDSEFVSITWRTAEKLVADIEGSGLALLAENWQEWKTALTGASQLPDSIKQGDLLSLRFEIVYGLAFGPAEGQPVKTRGGDVATFSVDSLKNSRLPR